MNIRIGLIDSGINTNHSIIKEENVINGWKGNYNDYNEADIEFLFIFVLFHE
jgi:hypothetical protein